VSEKWLIMLEKLDGTISNENRKSVRNNQYASHKANKLKVLKIINMYDSKNVIKTLKADRIYTIGENIVCSDFVLLPDGNCTSGIMYKNTLDAAFYSVMATINDMSYTGPHKEWFENSGIKLSEGFIKNGLFHGLWTDYYGNGVKRLEGEYENGKKIGTWCAYYENGSIMHRGVYNNGKIISSEKFSYDEKQPMPAYS
jgi:antitoxin component YwqK of YwqJK toxin-antitoxin module